MRRFAALILLAVSLLAISAMPAYAASLRVSAKAAPRSTGHVLFTAKVSRPSRVRVTVYKGSHAVKTLKAKKRGSKKYAANWNLTDKSGNAVAAGVYTYKVTATASRSTRSRRGTVTVIPPVVVAPPTTDPGTADPGTPVTPPTATPGRWVGFFQQGTPVSMDPLTRLESSVGAHSGVVNWYISDSNSFPTAQVKRVADHGSIPMITLEFWSVQSGGDAAIVNGSKDAYLNAFADAAKSYGGEVWIRPLHEMNGNWYPWCGTTNGNTPAQAVAAWRHIHDVFAARGATNVKFVWCVNNDSIPNTSANSADKYFPGDGYIDYMAIDGYNWGISDPSWSTWRTFSNLIGSSYTKVTALSAKPLFIAEIGCPEEGGSKAAWITDMFSQITSKYTRIQGVCWFNVDARETQNADWRVDSSAASAAAFKAAVASGF